MKFCEECNGLLRLKVEGNKTILICVKCNTKIEGTLILSEIPKKKEVGSGVSIPHENEKGFTFECERCNHDKCDVIDIGMMFGDEDWIYVLKCTKCGWSTRHGDAW